MIRRLVTATGIYVAAALGFLASIVAARTFSPFTFGLYATVIATTGFFQTLLDLTVEEAAVKYGFRFEAQREWGKLRRLLQGTLAYKLVGGLLAAVVLLALAPLAPHVWHTGGTELRVPLAIGAAIPLAQAPEGLAGVALFLRGRYDVRASFLMVSMVLRLVAVVVGSRYGLTETIAAIALAQVVATAAICIAGWKAFSRFPRAASEPLGDDRREIFSFILQSSGATGIVALRTSLTVPLLGAVTTPTQAGFFKVAQTPQQGLQTLSAPVRMILVTEQTRDWERGSRRAVLAGVRRYTLGAAVLMLVATPVLVWFMPDIVRLVFKPKNLGAVDAARLILVAGALQFLVGWSKSLPIAVGRPNLRIWTHLVETIVLLPLVAAFGVLWGATGAAAGVLVSSAAFVLAWAVLFLRISRDTRDLPPREEQPPELIEASVEVAAR
jgi:O-antigen/teichoic acid export membrane protein